MGCDRSKADKLLLTSIFCFKDRTDGRWKEGIYSVFETWDWWMFFKDDHEFIDRSDNSRRLIRRRQFSAVTGIWGQFFTGTQSPCDGDSGRMGHNFLRKINIIVSRNFFQRKKSNWMIIIWFWLHYGAECRGRPKWNKLFRPLSYFCQVMGWVVASQCCASVAVCYCHRMPLTWHASSLLAVAAGGDGILLWLWWRRW